MRVGLSVIAVAVASAVAMAVAGCGVLPDPDQPLDGVLCTDARDRCFLPVEDRFLPNRMLVAAERSCRAGLRTRQATLMGRGDRLVVTGTVKEDAIGSGSCDLPPEGEPFVTVLDVAALAAEETAPLEARSAETGKNAAKAAVGAPRTVTPDGTFLAFAARPDRTELLLAFDGERWSRHAGVAPAAAGGAEAPTLSSQALRLADGGLLVSRPPMAPMQRLQLGLIPPGGVEAVPLWPPAGPPEISACEEQLLMDLVVRFRAFEGARPGEIVMFGRTGVAVTFRAGEGPPVCDPARLPPAAITQAAMVRLPVWLDGGGGYAAGSLLALGGRGDDGQPQLAIHEPGAGWRALPVTLGWPVRHPVPVLLPDGRIAVVGGRSEDGRVLYLDPRRGFSVVPGSSQMARPRGLGTAAVLLPSGAVFIGAGHASEDDMDQRGDFQVLEPPYLAGGKARPVIRGGPGQLQYGGSFDLEVEAPAGEGSLQVVLMGFGNTIPGQNISQSLVELQVAAATAAGPGGGGRLTLTVTAPAPGSVAAPPGRYLLFVVDGARVPSAGIAVSLAGERGGS